METSVAKLNKEEKLLRISVIMASAMALTGLSIGILLDSQMILFDGFFSMISVALSALTLLMSRYIQIRDETQFPFGKNMIVPVVIVFKYTMIGLLCIFSIINATIILLDGGREISFEVATIYSWLALTVCYAVYLYIKKQINKLQSEILKVEASEWYMDAILSGAVLLGFLISWGASFTRFNFIVPYVDPIMVFMASLYFIRVPMLGILKNGREVLGMAPEPKVKEQIIHTIKSVENKYSIVKSYIRAHKAGKVIYVDVDFVVAKNSNIETIEKQDEIREEIASKLKEIPFLWWLTIAFTKNEKWAQ